MKLWFRSFWKRHLPLERTGVKILLASFYCPHILMRLMFNPWFCICLIFQNHRLNIYDSRLQNPPKKITLKNWYFSCFFMEFNHAISITAYQSLACIFWNHQVTLVYVLLPKIKIWANSHSLICEFQSGPQVNILQLSVTWFLHVKLPWPHSYI